jgi:hypothetical protein
MLLTAAFMVLATAATARALMIAPRPPSATRVATTDAIVIGRVVGLEDKDIALPSYPGAPATAKTTYRVAVVQVADVLQGNKTMKTVRVGFLPPAPLVQPGGGIRPGIRPGIRRLPSLTLKIGDTGLFYLTKHFQAPIHLATGQYDMTARTSPNFEKEQTEVRANVKLLENPMAGLKSADNKTRLMTAGLLIARYRNFRPGKTTTEPISAEESKLILTALAEADGWGTPVRFGDTQPHPQMLFGQLGVTQKDGFQPPQRVTTPQDYPNAVRAWLREHANTYRIQRIVPDNNAPVVPAPAPAPGVRLPR